MTYLTQSIIADDIYMKMRVAACAAGEGVTDMGIEPEAWTKEWRRVWSAAEGWDTKWEQAQTGAAARATPDPPLQTPLSVAGLTTNGPTYQSSADIGNDPDVITDQMIKDQVVAMKPFRTIESLQPQVDPLKMASRRFVQEFTQPMNDTLWGIIQKLRELTGDDMPFVIQHGATEKQQKELSQSPETFLD